MSDPRTPPPALPAGASLRPEVDLELRRVGTRLAGLGPARLDRAGADGVSPAQRVRPVLQALADTAADREGRPRRAVPQLAPHALGDQLVVLVRDVLAVGQDDGEVLEDLRDRLVALRRSL